MWGVEVAAATMSHLGHWKTKPRSAGMVGLSKYPCLFARGSPRRVGVLTPFGIIYFAYFLSADLSSRPSSTIVLGQLPPQ